MSDQPMNELDGTTRQAVERWREEALPPADLDAALERIERHLKALPQPRLPWRLAPAGLAAGLLLFMLVWVPAAWAEVAEAVHHAPVEAAPRPAPHLRTLLIVHVCFLMAAYLPFSLAWGALQLDLLLGLFGRSLGQWPARLAPAGAAVGTLLWLIGMILGCFWAEAVWGRFWLWDSREVMAVFTVVVGVGWWALGRHWRQAAPVLPALVAAAAFWLLVDIWWGSLSLVRGTGLWASALVIALASLLNALLLAAAWLQTRQRQANVG